MDISEYALELIINFINDSKTYLSFGLVCKIFYHLFNKHKNVKLLQFLITNEYTSEDKLQMEGPPLVIKYECIAKHLPCKLLHGAQYQITKMNDKLHSLVRGFYKFGFQDGVEQIIKSNGKVFSETFYVRGIKRRTIEYYSNSCVYSYFVGDLIVRRLTYFDNLTFQKECIFTKERQTFFGGMLIKAENL